MRNRVRWTRRAAAGFTLVLATLVATGPGAAAATPLDQYSATASGTVLGLNVQLPAELGVVSSTLNQALSQAGLTLPDLSKIDERISYSLANAQVVNQAKTIVGKALSQVFSGTLDGTLLSAGKLLSYNGSSLPQSSASLPTGASCDKPATQAFPAIDLPTADISLLHVGLAETTACSVKGVNVVKNISTSTLAGIRIGLADVLSMPELQQVLGPLTDVTDELLGQVNGALKQLTDTLAQQGLDLDLELPNLTTLLQTKPLIEIGIMQSISENGYEGLARISRGVAKLANVDLLGGFIHIDALEVDALARIDGTVAGAAPTNVIQRVVGLKVGDSKILDLTSGSLTLLGKEIAIPSQLTDLLNTTIDTLGLKIELAPKPTVSESAFAAAAAGRTLSISLAPSIAGKQLFSIALEGPSAMADVRGANVLQKTVANFEQPTTGLRDTAALLAGLVLISVAVLVRRFVLVK